MCGIVAAAADNNLVPVLVEGRKKLEYHRYDSAGLAVIGKAGIKRSDIDTESVTQPVDVEAALQTAPDLFVAVRLACQRLVGACAIAVIDHSKPGKVIAAREGSPLLLGLTDTGNYAASDASTLLQVTRNLVYHAVNGTDVDKRRNLAKSVTVE